MLDFVGKEMVGQTTAFSALSRFARIAGKRVLEVGGNSNCIAATPFAEAGASKVVVTGLYHMNADEKPDNPIIQLAVADALKLTETYADNSLDFVYGISILEHIPLTTRFLTQISRVLTKGGMAFVQGSPIWTGPWGHHIHLTPWQDGTTGVYQFIPDSILLEKGVRTFNPIPDWGHLLYTKEELRDILECQDIPAEDVPRILSFVYDEDIICRETSKSFVDAIYSSGLSVVELEYDRVQINVDILEKLRDRHGEHEDYSIMGLRVILRKN